MHLTRTVLCGFLATPVAVSFLVTFRLPFLVLPVAALAGLVMGWWPASRAALPAKTWQRYGLPVLGIWVLFFGFFLAIIMRNFGEGTFATGFVPHLYITGYIAGFILRERRRPDRAPLSPWMWAALLCGLALPASHIAFETRKENTYHAKRGHGFERVGGFSSTDLKPYDPRNPENTLPRLNATASFTISGIDRMPVLDGAEAAFPVYAAFAGACYKDLRPLSAEELKQYDYTSHTRGPLTFTNTVYGFQRLLEGKVDIFFGAHPSQQQMEAAALAGKELLLTPIGKEAFVFFVNEQNPVNGLATAQFRGIYSATIRNWKELNGDHAPIMAFQRPENSGSQTIMRRFMGDTPMERPLKDHYVSAMGGAVDSVSEYHNAPAAIGYSFRYFLTGMGKKPRIKLLSLDGVPPTAETIRTGRYPYVVNLYAITVKDSPNSYVAPFLRWMQGPQGQELLEKVGYVSLE